MSSRAESRLTLSHADLARLLAEAPLDELRNMRARLVMKLKAIEGALSSDKYDFKEDCAGLLAEGHTPREAMILAQAQSDFDWRRRAVVALQITSSQISALNARMAVLGGDQHQTRKVTVFRGTVNEIAAQLQYLVDIGGAVYGLASVFDVGTKQDVVIAVVATKERANG